jgi:hypothetical protein
VLRHRPDCRRQRVSRCRLTLRIGATERPEDLRDSTLRDRRIEIEDEIDRSVSIRVAIADAGRALDERAFAAGNYLGSKWDRTANAHAFSVDDDLVSIAANKIPRFEVVRRNSKVDTPLSSQCVDIGWTRAQYRSSR